MKLIVFIKNDEILGFEKRIFYTHDTEIFHNLDQCPPKISDLVEKNKNLTLKEFKQLYPGDPEISRQIFKFYDKRLKFIETVDISTFKTICYIV